MPQEKEAGLTPLHKELLRRSAHRADPALWNFVKRCSCRNLGSSALLLIIHIPAGHAHILCHTDILHRQNRKYLDRSTRKKELVQLRLCCNSLRQQGNPGLEILQIDNLHR